MKTGIELIATERKEQLEKHGRTIKSDVQTNTNNELIIAAGSLAYKNIDKFYLSDLKPDGWDEKIWEKMCKKPYLERLIIAGALIAAEIDRLQNTNKQ